MMRYWIQTLLTTVFLFNTVRAQITLKSEENKGMLFSEKYVFHANTAFTTYGITEINRGDSLMGRSTIYVVNMAAGRRLYKPVFAGLKAQYQLFHSTFFTASNINYQSGVYTGVWLGTEFINLNEKFYAGFRFHAGINSIRMQDYQGYSNIIRSIYWFHDYGFELNGGLRIGNQTHLTLGLCLTNLFDVNEELNYLQLGLLFSFPKPQNPKPKWFKPKSKASY
jgi:hypothetical protein